MKPRRPAEHVAIEGFCGAGGMSLGLRNAGFRIGAAFDLNEAAIRTYRRNHGDHGFVADIRSVTADSLRAAAAPGGQGITLVAGGPPCQGFSVQRRRGEDDPRNSLPVAFLDLIKGLAPRFFIFENVPGIRGRHGEAILSTFLSDARAAGFHCHTATLDAVNYGVPQSRRRVFIVGEATDDGRTWFDFPQPVTTPTDPDVTVGAALSGLPPPPPNHVEHPAIANHRRIRLSEVNELRLSHVPQGGGMMDLPVELRVKCHRNGADRIGHRYVYGRLDWAKPAATITARFDSFTRGKFGHPLENRNITLREGARLQTFPDEYVFEGTQEEVAAQIGNAVPPRLAQVLGAAILDAIKRRAAGHSGLKASPPQQFALFK